MAKQISMAIRLIRPICMNILLYQGTPILVVVLRYTGTLIHESVVGC